MKKFIKVYWRVDYRRPQGGYSAYRETADVILKLDGKIYRNKFIQVKLPKDFNGYMVIEDVKRIGPNGKPLLMIIMDDNMFGGYSILERPCKEKTFSKIYASQLGYSSDLLKGIINELS